MELWRGQDTNDKDIVPKTASWSWVYTETHKVEVESKITNWQLIIVPALATKLAFNGMDISFYNKPTGITPDEQ